MGLTEQLLFQQISKVHYNEWREALVKQVHNQAEHDVDAAQYEEVGHQLEGRRTVCELEP